MCLCILKTFSFVVLYEIYTGTCRENWNFQNTFTTGCIYQLYYHQSTKLSNNDAVGWFYYNVTHRLLIGNKEIVCLFILLLLIVKLTYYDLLIQKCMCVSYPVQY